MIEELATVVNANDDVFDVVSEVKSSCSGCQQVDNCGSGQIAKAFPTKKLSLTLKSDLPINQGDTVVLGIPEGCIVESAWQVYLYPLFGLIVFSALGQYWVNNHMLSHELYAVLFSGIGGYLGFLLAKKKQKTVQRVGKLTPKILRVVHQKIPIVTL